MTTERAAQSPENEAWLALTPEESIEPEIPIIDPHHHMWHRPDGNRYVLEDFLADAAGNNVRQSVYIQAGAMYRGDSGPEEFRVVGEIEWVNGIAAESATGQWGETRVAAGIVGTADLSLGDRVAPVLEAMVQVSPRRFRGIRHSTWWVDPPVRPGPAQRPGMLAEAEYRKGFSYLNQYGLSYVAWLFHPQILELAELARAFPETTIILNHLGGPLGVAQFEGKHDEVFEAWRPMIVELAKCENVVAKIGGIGMPYLNGVGWEKGEKPPASDAMVEVNRRWFEHMIEQFGPNRCMFESNFPPDKGSSSYTVLWNHFKKLTKGFTAEERLAMFHETARRVYRLPQH